MGKRGTRPQKKVSTEWSPKLAYAVGLITTDGCLSTDGRHIDFTSKDIQLIDLFKTCLSVEHVKTGSKMSGYSGKRYTRVQFGDIHFYQWLQGIGLTPKKSLTLGPLKVPDELFFDFVRGCFDGDGTIYSFWDRRWVDSFMFYIAFASGSKKFLLWLQKKIYEFSGIKGHISSDAKQRVLQLRYAKGESIVLFQRMFYSQDVPHLIRKRLKAQKIFDQHNKIVERNRFARVVKFRKHATLRGWCP